MPCSWAYEEAKMTIEYALLIWGAFALCVFVYVLKNASDEKKATNEYKEGYSKGYSEGYSKGTRDMKI